MKQGLALLLLLGFTLAHQPTLEQPGNTLTTALVLPDVQVSYAIYTGLTKASPVHWYKFKAKQGENLYAQISVPQIKGLEGFAPTLALVGPGLAPPKGLPFSLPEGWGAAVVAPGAPKAFYEPFGGHHYWIRQTLEFPAPLSGEYAFVVWHPQGQTGKYVLAPGRQERFDAAAFGRAFSLMPSIHKYMQSGPEFGPQSFY